MRLPDTANFVAWLCNRLEFDETIFADLQAERDEYRDGLYEIAEALKKLGFTFTPPGTVENTPAIDLQNRLDKADETIKCLRDELSTAGDVVRVNIELREKAEAGLRVAREALATYQYECDRCGHAKIMHTPTIFAVMRDSVECDDPRCERFTNAARTALQTIDGGER